MVRNPTITSAVSAELTTSLRQTLAGQRLRSLEQWIALPNSLSTFVWLLLGVVLICAGLTLHIVLSMQIYQVGQQVTQLRADYQAVERQNAELVWSITQHSSLAQLQERALALGYEVPQARHYVAIPTVSGSTAIDPASPLASSTHSVAIATTPEPALPTANLFDWLQQHIRSFAR
jgi:hypothetical protein